MNVRLGPCLLTVRKSSRFSRPKPEGTSSHLLLGAQDQRLGAEHKTNFLVVTQEPLLTTLQTRKLASFGHVKRHDSISRTILQGMHPWGVRDFVVGIGNAGWTT